MPTQRTQRFYAGQLVTDINGFLLEILAVHLDPAEVKGYESNPHHSARYDTKYALDNVSDLIDFSSRHDWELKLFTN